MPNSQRRSGETTEGYVRSLRALVGSRIIFAPGVRAIVANEAGEVLLQHRTDFQLWGLPAGAVELDETALQAVVREVEEETTLRVLEAEPMALYSGPSQRFSYPNGDRVQGFAIAFIIRRWQGTPRADGHEGSEVRFFPLADLPDNIVTIHRRSLDDYLAYDGTFLLRG